MRVHPPFLVRRLRSREQYVVACAQSLAFQSRSAWHAPSTSQNCVASGQTRRVGCCRSETELDFLRPPCRVDVGSGPVTQARLAEIGVHTIGQLAKMPGYSLSDYSAARREKLTALAWNRDQGNQDASSNTIGWSPVSARRSRLKSKFSTHATSSCGQGREQASAKSRPGRTVTVRVRFADSTRHTLRNP